MDWATRESAKYAVEHWHYSGCFPVGKLVCVGAWEDKRYIGAVLFGRGAGPQVARYFNVKQTEMAELVRVALRQHVTPTSRIVAIALKILYRLCPGLKFVVSFADYTNQQHYGILYQAGNWIYLGQSKAKHLIIDGVERHSRLQLRGYRQKHPKAIITYTDEQIKYRYVYPFNAEFRRQFESEAQPYPKRAGSIENDATDIQSDQGGATPTSALQNIGGS